MREIILKEPDIEKFEQIINSLPSFARNVSEATALAESIKVLMDFMGSKVIKPEDGDNRETSSGSS